MHINHAATAGTLESSDVMVTIEPAQNGIEIFLQSPVIHQFGKQIRSVALQTLTAMGVEHARVFLVDKGALDCTIKARVECAVFRAADAQEENVPWEVLG